MCACVCVCVCVGVCVSLSFFLLVESMEMVSKTY